MTKPKYPATRWGWYQYYAKQFGLNGSVQAEHLACWYLILHLAFDAEDAPCSSA